MLVDVNFGLLAKYLLFADCVCMLFCAQLIYIRDLDNGVYRPPDKALSVLNAKIFFYCNSLLASLVYLYWLLERTCVLTLFVLGTAVHLVCRLCFAYYFHFFHNGATMLGLLFGGYYRYVLWYEVDSRAVVDVPACWSTCSDGEDGQAKARKKSLRKSKKSHRRRKSGNDTT